MSFILEGFKKAATVAGTMLQRGAAKAGSAIGKSPAAMTSFSMRWIGFWLFVITLPFLLPIKFFASEWLFTKVRKTLAPAPSSTGGKEADTGGNGDQEQ